MAWGRLGPLGIYLAEPPGPSGCMADFYSSFSSLFSRKWHTVVWKRNLPAFTCWQLIQNCLKPCAGQIKHVCQSVVTSPAFRSIEDLPAHPSQFEFFLFWVSAASAFLLKLCFICILCVFSSPFLSNLLCFLQTLPHSVVFFLPVFISSVKSHLGFWSLVVFFRITWSLLDFWNCMSCNKTFRSSYLALLSTLWCKKCLKQPCSLLGHAKNRSG